MGKLFRKDSTKKEPPKPVNVEKALNLYKFDLMDMLLNRTYLTFSMTLDTEDFVPENVNKKIRKNIFKQFKKSYKKIKKTYKRVNKYGAEGQEKTI